MISPWRGLPLSAWRASAVLAAVVGAPIVVLKFFSPHLRGYWRVRGHELLPFRTLPSFNTNQIDLAARRFAFAKTREAAGGP
jgi:hypothetical protein